MIEADVVIIGSGQAGAQVAISLREAGFVGSVTIVGNEPGLPYQRPPLSKAFMLGKAEESSLCIRQAGFYIERKITLLDGVSATRIDLSSRSVLLEPGGALLYGHLILATGARNRPLPVEGAGLEGVLYLRTLVEARKLKHRIANVRTAVVIGGGFIGLEFASVASALGVGVTVVEAQDRIMARVSSPQVSSYFRKQHEQRGVKFVFNDPVERILGSEGKVTAVETAGGAKLESDVVLVAVGVVPNSELAAAAGLSVGNGIVVDENLSTQDPAVSAIGDCAEYPNFFTKSMARLESVQNAVDQAKTVAARIMNRSSPFRNVPWFWSDQGTDKLQIAGIPSPGDLRMVVGDESEKRFSVISYRENAMVAVESVNRAADHVAARKLLQSGRRLNVSAVAEPGFELKLFAAKESVHASEYSDTSPNVNT